MEKGNSTKEKTAETFIYFFRQELELLSAMQPYKRMATEASLWRFWGMIMTAHHPRFDKWYVPCLNQLQSPPRRHG